MTHSDALFVYGFERECAETQRLRTRSPRGCHCNTKAQIGLTESRVRTLGFPGGEPVAQLPVEAAGIAPVSSIRAAMRRHHADQELMDRQTTNPCLLIPRRTSLCRRGESDTIGILHFGGGGTVGSVIDVTSTVAHHVRSERNRWLPPFPGRLRVCLAP
jgi:hypothetical protein